MPKEQKTHKPTLYDIFGPHPTSEGRAALMRARQHAAQEQADLLKKAAALDAKK